MRHLRVVGFALLLVGSIGLSAPAAQADGTPAPQADAGQAAQGQGPLGQALHAIRSGCGVLQQGLNHCFSQVLALPSGQPNTAAAAQSGFGPSDLASAYKLPATGGAGKTVAIVDAFDDPKAETDLAAYRSNYGLAPCTTANGCFRKVSQSATSPLPNPDAGWAVEVSLDLDMVSAVCPGCHILLVEATSNSNANLYAAEDRAFALGATTISNSWGGGESRTEASSDSHFNHAGVPITVSSGDSGYGVEYPASSPYVTAVGGTSLTKSTAARGWSETVWSGAGSGCSAYEAKPSWQKDTGCARRTVADVAAVADPNTGVAVYDSYSSGSAGANGWIRVGGTSVGAPIIAAVYALAGNAASTTAGSFSYAHTGSLFDVTSGTNSTGSGGLFGLFGCHNYLCTGGTGYDGPTGNGTPNGTGAF